MRIVVYGSQFVSLDDVFSDDGTAFIKIHLLFLEVIKSLHRHMHDIGEFPGWLRLTHFINFLFLTLLIRSGLQILADHPKLYLNDHCMPGNQWFKFGKRIMPQDSPWTSSLQTPSEAGFDPYDSLQ